MEIPDFDDMRADKAKQRAKKFFDMLSEKRRKEKAEKRELRESKEILREVEKNRSEAIKASLRGLKKPSVVPQPPSPEQSPEAQEPVKTVTVDQASLDFWRWCVGKEEKEEEPPPWRVRNTRLYKGTRL